MEASAVTRANNLSSVSSEDLTRLVRALHRGSLPSPVSRSALIAGGFGNLEALLDPLVGKPASAAQAIIAAVLDERAARREARPARLLFSGIPLPGSSTGDSLEHVKSLLGGARERIDMVGVTLGDDRRLMRSLAAILEGRGLSSRIVLDGRVPDARERALAFAAEHFPRVTPELYVCSSRALTARVVVVDDAQVLVTSAELTGSEDDGRIDVGVVLEDRSYAQSLREEWERLITHGVFERL